MRRNKLRELVHAQHAREHGVSFTGHCRCWYRLNSITGVPSLETETPCARYDPRLRPWYIESVEAGGAVWSSIYPFSESTLDHTPLGITAARPIYSPYGGELLGVAALDFVLEGIEKIVLNLLDDSSAYNSTATTHAFILDGHTTNLVAASVKGIATNADGMANALNVSDPIIRRAAAYVLDTITDDSDEGAYTFEREWWVQSLFMKDAYGLSWRIVTMQRIHCLAGFMNVESSRTGACTACLPGESGAGGTAECEPCAPGYIAPDPKTAMCAPCPPGTYANEDATACLGCPGRRTSREGASTCDMCKEGFFQDLDVLPWPILTDADNDCIKCVRGMTCAASQFDGVGLHTSEVVVEKGYWRLTQTTDRIRVCPGGRKACVGGNAVGDELCAPGHSGPLCTVW